MAFRFLRVFHRPKMQFLIHMRAWTEDAWTDGLTDRLRHHLMPLYLQWGTHNKAHIYSIHITRWHGSARVT